MNKDIINSIFLNIVRTWPESKCNQLNTFFVIDTGEEFDTENLNSTMLDFRKGHFWQRQWIQSGAHPDQLCKKYPILGIEQKRVTAKDWWTKQVCHNYWIVLTDIPDCSDCPNECNRTKDEVDADLYNSAIILLQELKKYKKWMITVDTNNQYTWMTKNQIDYMLTEGLIDNAVDAGDEVLLHVKSEPLNIQSTSVGSSDGARAVSFMLQFCDCPVIKPDFNYKFKAPAEKSITTCFTCQ